ncbi:LPS biosynthesis protein, partial [Francisella tularensis subsp. holarctica]|nr:LPS biosynthesis protein [Francisella tularensis subsp. holarctica]
KSLLKPKYWGIWFIIWIDKFIVNLLPYKMLMRLAIGIGLLAKPLLKKRQPIALSNLKIAFPVQSDQDIKQLVDAGYKEARL